MHQKPRVSRKITHFRTDIKKMILTPGTGGIFEVTVNGEKIYSKDDTGLFPKNKEIIEKIEAL